MPPGTPHDHDHDHGHDPAAPRPPSSAPAPAPPDGFSVLAVTGDLTGCDWAHTLGLHATTGHPELVLVGLPAPLAAALLESLGERVLRGDQLAPGAVVRLGPLHLRMEVVDDVFVRHGDWFGLGRRLLGDEGRRWPRTLQVVWADDEGFPEPGGDPRWLGRQPLLVDGDGSLVAAGRARDRGRGGPRGDT